MYKTKLCLDSGLQIDLIDDLVIFDRIPAIESWYTVVCIGIQLADKTMSWNAKLAHEQQCDVERSNDPHSEGKEGQSRPRRKDSAIMCQPLI